jgi:serine protease AprX
VNKRQLFFVVVVWVLSVNNVGISANSDSSIFLKSFTIDTSAPSVQANFSANSLSDKSVYVLVQFKGRVLSEYKTELKKLGVEFINYIPQNAFLVRVQQKAVHLLERVKFVKWVGAYKPEYKLEPTLLNLEAQSQSQWVHVNIKLFSNKASEALRSLVLKNEGTVVYAKGDIVQVSIQRKSLLKLAEQTEVEWIEEVKKVKLLNFLVDEDDAEKSDDTDPPADGNYEDLTGYESGVKILNVEQAYQYDLTGAKQVVGVADTGLDEGNVKGALSDDFDGAVRKGYALGFFRTTWEDQMGHGTHVAGSILGRGAFSEGRLAGVAYNADIVVQGLVGMFGSLNIPADLADLFDPVYDDGARIHSNSWGNPQATGYDQMSRSVDKFIWENPNMLILFAGGNSGEDKDKDGVIDERSILSPGNAKNVLTVGASENLVADGGIQKKWSGLRNGKDKWGAEPVASDTPSDNIDGLAAFSSRGPTADGRIKPDIVAPGTNILSARSHHEKAGVLWGAFNDDYAWSGGTSMSTPLTAGAATLIRQFYVETQASEDVSAALIKATLLNGAKDMYPGQFGFGDVLEIPTKRPNVHEGWGRVDVDKTLFSEDRKIRYIDKKKGVKGGITDEFTITVENSSEPLSITLVYSDHPAAAEAKKTLVNDLDLEVISALGAKHYPNGKRRADRTNNVESVDLSAPEEGEYTVRVVGYHVPSGIKGAQPYALVVSGGIQ